MGFLFLLLAFCAAVGFFCCYVLHRKRINGGRLIVLLLIAVYGICIVPRHFKRAWFCFFFSLVGPAVVASFFVLFAHVGAAAAGT